MTSAQVVETSVTNNSSFQNYTHPDDHTIRTTDTPGFKPFTMIIKIADTAKKIDFAHTFYIDRPLYQVTKTGLVCCNIYFFFESN